MNIRLAASIAGCAATLLATAATADPLAPATLAAAEALAADAARSLAPAGARIEAAAGTLDARLKLAPCSRVEPYLAAGARAWGSTRVGLRCTQGAAWNVYLPLTVKVWAPAAVTPVPLAAGAVVDGTQLQTALVDWAADPATPLAAGNVAGRVLARPLLAGQPLRAGDLRTRQWFAAGDTVRIVASGNGYSVQAEGQALSNGLEGLPARVRIDGGRIVSGVAAGERLVELPL